MDDKRQAIFREVALERLSSPERLDTLVRIIGPRHWIPLLTIAAGVAAAVAWGIVGRIPITASARALLLRPRTIRAVQAPGTGALVEFSVREGDVVKKGQEIGSIDQYEIRNKLEQERQKLRALESHRATSAVLDKKSGDLELEALRRQRAHLEARAKELKELGEIQKKVDDAALEQDKAAFVERLRNAHQTVESAQKRVATYEQLRKQGVARDEEILDAERVRIEASNRVLDVERDLQQTRLREAELERQRRELFDRIANLSDQVAEIDVKERRVAKDDLDAQAAYEREKRALDDSIASLELALARQGRIASEWDGRVLELSVSVGQQVSQGMRLALVEEGDPTREVVCVAYLPVRDGKRTIAGTRAQVEPDTVQRERYGGIVATVRDVSSFPVSAESVASLTGSAEVARALLADGAKIQVTLELERDPATTSGYRWSSSRGPEMKITSGTTASVLVHLEERAPITFVMPYLRSLLGL